MMVGGVIVAYSGVHQIFQLALAAAEMDRLDRFYCSFFDAPGKWGRLARKMLGADALVNRRVSGISSPSVEEYPWPWITHTISSKFKSSRRKDWLIANDQFDRWVAGRLHRTGSKVLVSSETCAQHSIKEAKSLGIVSLLDCPQMHPSFLEKLYREAGEKLGIPIQCKDDSPQMTERKNWEFENADLLLAPSELAKRSFCEIGIPSEKIIVTPLWADLDLWFPEPESRRPEFTRNDNGPLRVLFVGGVNWRKGIPFLMDAARRCGKSLQLTLVGPRADEMEDYLAENREHFTWIEPQTKPELRKVYCRHDVLALPSLADTYGLVGMEAMACGLPVIATENCGVPLPDANWRVPVMDSVAIEHRLQLYITDRRRLWEDGEKARQFASQFTPKRYREQIKALYQSILQND